MILLYPGVSLSDLTKSLGFPSGLANLSEGSNSNLVLSVEEARFIGLQDLEGTFHVPCSNPWRLGIRVCVNTKVVMSQKRTHDWQSVESLKKLLAGDDNVVDLIDWVSVLNQTERDWALVFSGIEREKGGTTFQARMHESMAEVIQHYELQKNS